MFMSMWREEKEVKVIGNCFVDIKKHIDFSIDDLNIKEKVRYKVLRNLRQFQYKKKK